MERENERRVVLEKELARWRIELEKSQLSNPITQEEIDAKKTRRTELEDELKVAKE